MNCLLCEEFLEIIDTEDFEIIEVVRKRKEVFCECDKVHQICVECGMYEEIGLMDVGENVDFQECWSCYEGKTKEYSKLFIKEEVNL